MMSLVRSLRSLLPLFPLLSLAACADSMEPAPPVTTDGVSDAELHLLAAVDRPGGNQLRLYEPTPGHLLAIELGSGPVLPDMNDAVELYKLAAPGAAVPANLLAAQERMDATMLLERPSDMEHSVNKLSLSPELAVDALPAAGHGARSLDPCALNTFVQQQCLRPDDDFRWCKLTWANGFFASSSSVDSMHNAVCPLTGDVRLRLVIDSSLKGSWRIPQGSFGHAAWYGGDFGFFTEITDAVGVQFRVGGGAITS
jgi:hypothetical protein